MPAASKSRIEDLRAEQGADGFERWGVESSGLSQRPVNSASPEQELRLGPGALGLPAGGLGSRQGRRDLTTLAIERHEGVDFAAKHAIVDGLEQVVDRSRFVSLEDPRLVTHARGDKDDRHMTRALDAAHGLGELDPIHFGHLHVDERDRHQSLEQDLERVAARTRGDDRHVVAPQDAFHRKEVVRDVIDHERARPIVGRRSRVAISRPWLNAIQGCVIHVSHLER